MEFYITTPAPLLLTTILAPVKSTASVDTKGNAGCVLSDSDEVACNQNIRANDNINPCSILADLNLLTCNRSDSSSCYNNSRAIIGNGNFVPCYENIKPLDLLKQKRVQKKALRPSMVVAYLATHWYIIR